MISFIIIGKNESWRLSKCFESIKQLIEYNSLTDTEIIYVDSDSSDSSIEIAKSYNANKIYKIKGESNAAIARNVGANAATGKILFFMDGDIEIKPFDLKTIVTLEPKLRYGYVVGFLDDVNYTSDWEYINQTPRSYKTVIKDQKVSTVGGGIFIIEKERWNHYGGMNERLVRSQDRDMSLRMSKHNNFGIRKAKIFGLHHTIPYKDSNRMWKMLLNGQIMFKGVFIRKHFVNKLFFSKMIAEDYTVFILALTLLCMPFSPFISIIYIFFALYKTRKYLRQGIKMFQVFLHRILQDILVLFSIFLFFPAKPKYTIQQL